MVSWRHTIRCRRYPSRIAIDNIWRINAASIFTTAIHGGSLVAHGAAQFLNVDDRRSWAHQHLGS